MAWFVYVLQCADGSLYTGITTDVTRRLSEHLGRGGLGARYTRTHPVMGIVAAWHAQDRADASRMEWCIKQLPHAAKEELVTCGEAWGHERATEEELALWWRAAADAVGSKGVARSH